LGGEKGKMDHTIMHFEIPADNVDKLKTFYEKVFGWKINQAEGPIEYWLIETVPVNSEGRLLRSGVNGGMYKRQETANRPINYFAVESISDFLAKIVKLGGKVIQPKEEVPNVGWIAAAADPEGNQFALLEPIRV
jgi:uncharacterized protein